MRRATVVLVAIVGLLAGGWWVVRAQATTCRDVGAWSCGEAMPTQRSELQGAVLGDRIYFAGGLGRGGSILDTFEAYLPSDDRWETLASLPRPMHHVALAALDGRIYLSGGYSSLRMAEGERYLWAYEPETDRWLELADMPAPRAAHIMLATGGQLYVVGGITGDIASLWRYDPAGDSWSDDLPRMPTPREHLAGGVIDSELYLVGGRLNGNLASLEIYDPVAEAWRGGPPLPTARGGLTAAVVAGRLHVLGGEAFRPAKTFDEHEVFDPASNSWLTFDPLPTARHGLASASLGGRLYIVGGATLAGGGTFVSLTGLVSIYQP